MLVTCVYKARVFWNSDNKELEWIKSRYTERDLNYMMMIRFDKDKHRLSRRTIIQDPSVLDNTMMNTFHLKSPGPPQAAELSRLPRRKLKYLSHLSGNPCHHTFRLVLQTPH